MDDQHQLKFYCPPGKGAYRLLATTGSMGGQNNSILEILTYSDLEWPTMMSCLSTLLIIPIPRQYLPNQSSSSSSSPAHHHLLPACLSAVRCPGECGIYTLNTFPLLRLHSAEQLKWN